MQLGLGLKFFFLGQEHDGRGFASRSVRFLKKFAFARAILPAERIRQWGRRKVSGYLQLVVKKQASMRFMYSTAAQQQQQRNSNSDR